MSPHQVTLWGLSMFIILSACFCLTSSEVFLPEPTLIEEQAQPFTEKVLWPFDNLFEYIIDIFNWILAWICFPFRYVVWGFLELMESVAAVPVLIITFLVNMIGILLRLPLEFIRKFWNALIDIIICFPANFILTLAYFAIHAPLNFIGIDVCSYLTWAIVSIDIAIINVSQGVVNFIFNSITFVLVDVVLHGVIKTLLELPVWMVYHVIRFPAVLFDSCIEITSSALILLVSRALMIVGSLLRLACFAVTYAVIFIGYWALDIFLLLMTVIIGLAAWLFLVAVLGLVYLSVKFFRKPESAWTIVQSILDRYQQIRNPSIDTLLSVMLEMFPRELWVKLFDSLLVTPADDENVCAICFDSQCFVIVMPCGHNNMCESCVEEVRQRSNVCPMCRAVIMFHIPNNV